MADERIARCRLAIGRDANNFAQVIVQLLRHIPGCWTRVVSIADQHEQIAVLGRWQCRQPVFVAAGKAAMAGDGRGGAKDDMNISQRTLSFIEQRPGDVCVAVVVIDPLEKSEEDAAVGGKVGIEGHVKNAKLRRSGNGGKPGEGCGQDALFVEDPHRARQFSVMRIFPSGRNARDHGACSVLTRVVIVKGAVA